MHTQTDNSKNVLTETAADVKNLQNKIDDTLKEKCPEELESHENLLFQEISSTVIKILTDPSTNEAFLNLKNKLGMDVSKELVELLSTVTTFATYNAIAFYDMTIKEQMTQNFAEIGGTIMKHGGDIDVLRLKIGDIDKKILMNKLQGAVDAE